MSSIIEEGFVPGLPGSSGKCVKGRPYSNTDLSKRWIV